MKYLKFTAYLLTLSLFSMNISSVSAAPQQMETLSKSFSVKLGATRVIYPEKSSGAQLSISNLQSYPILVQSSVVGEDLKTPAPFLVTPPLFRLDANQQSRLRIIRTGGNLASGRESLYWLCVKALPPSEDDTADNSEKVMMAINLVINSCNKLLYRPADLKGNPEALAASLRWSREGEVLHVSNPTPFYMNLMSVKVGGKPIHGLNYVKPLGEASFGLNANSSGEVTWTVINDQGGESRTFSAPL